MDGHWQQYDAVSANSGCINAKIDEDRISLDGVSTPIMVGILVVGRTVIISMSMSGCCEQFTIYLSHDSHYVIM